MRDTLPGKSRKNESAIVNLDISTNSGTHWVAYVKKDNIIRYYDSFGVSPPSELLRYWGRKCTVLANHEQDQRLDQVICGHLCLKFINKHGR